jgi:hypothetical protein
VTVILRAGLGVLISRGSLVEVLPWNPVTYAMIELFLAVGILKIKIGLHFIGRRLLGRALSKRGDQAPLQRHKTREGIALTRDVAYSVACWRCTVSSVRSYRGFVAPVVPREFCFFHADRPVNRR